MSTSVSIVSHYRKFEPISRDITTESKHKPTAIERQLTKLYDKQQHMMRQLSDLRASVSDLSTAASTSVQIQVLEKERLCNLCVFNPVSKSWCVMHVLMLVTCMVRVLVVKRSQLATNLQVVKPSVSVGKTVLSRCLSDLVVYVRVCLCTDERIANVLFAFPRALFLVFSLLHR